jgi:hypothetical protein
MITLLFIGFISYIWLFNNSSLKIFSNSIMIFTANMAIYHSIFIIAVIRPFLNEKLHLPASQAH